MHMPSAQPLSPSFSALFADYEGLRPTYLRATAEEDRLLTIFNRNKPRSRAAAVALRTELGVDTATAESDRLNDDLADIAGRIYDAEPANWPDLVAVAGLVRQRNGVNDRGDTNGLVAEELCRRLGDGGH